MENVIVAVTEKLPPEYLMILLPLILISGVWLFTRIRRDKQGKIYFYSTKYEDKKRNDKHDKMLTILTSVKNDIKKGEKDRNVLYMINLKQSVYMNDPFPIEERIYAGLEYIAAGGNGEVKRYVIEELIAHNFSIYKTIVNMKPELELKNE